jgi:hypothetical protein
MPEQNLVALKMEAARYSKTSEQTSHLTQYENLEGRYFGNTRLVDPKI